MTHDELGRTKQASTLKPANDPTIQPLFVRRATAVVVVVVAAVVVAAACLLSSSVSLLVVRGGLVGVCVTFSIYLLVRELLCCGVDCMSFVFVSCGVVWFGWVDVRQGNKRWRSHAVFV